jgi:cytosine/adenosine deaminase-related metal-dependent hydrolase
VSRGDNGARMTAEHQASDLLLRADWVLPIDGPPLADGVVRVRGDRIVAISSARQTGQEVGRRVDLGTAALLPGLVNVHTHLELTLLRGVCESLDFFAWIRDLTRIKYGHMERDDFALGARWGLVEALRHGVTTLGDCGDQGVVQEALVESGLRGIVYHEVFGPDPADCDAALARLTEQLLDARRMQVSDRVSLGISPHAPYTVSDDLFRAVLKFAGGEVPLTLHVAESSAESAYVRDGQGPFADFLRGRGIACEPKGLSPVAYLDELGVLAARPLLVHGCEMDVSDVELVAQAGASVAHCPKSNAKLGHRQAPLEAWCASGVRVGLGSDGVVSNNTCDLLEEARSALQLARIGGSGANPSLDAEAALRLATLGGAEALGLAHQVGSITPGKRADLIAIDLTGPHMQPLYDVSTALVFGARGNDVCWSMVNGKVLLEGGRVVPFDEPALAAEVVTRAVRLGAIPRS